MRPRRSPNPSLTASAIVDTITQVARSTEVGHLAETFRVIVLVTTPIVGVIAGLTFASGYRPSTLGGPPG